MANKAFTPDQNNRPAPRSGEKGYSGHKLPAKPQQPPQTPTSQPTSGPDPKPSSTEKK